MRQLFLTAYFRLMLVEGIVETENHHLRNNNCCFTSVDAKISGWKHDEKQDIYMVLKCLHTVHFLIIMKKIITTVKIPSTC